MSGVVVVCVCVCVCVCGRVWCFVVVCAHCSSIRQQHVSVRASCTQLQQQTSTSHNWRERVEGRERKKWFKWIGGWVTCAVMINTPPLEAVQPLFLPNLVP